MTHAMRRLQLPLLAGCIIFPALASAGQATTGLEVRVTVLPLWCDDPAGGASQPGCRRALLFGAQQGPAEAASAARATLRPATVGSYRVRGLRGGGARIESVTTEDGAKPTIISF